jgi:uncharacterized protein
MSNKEKLRALLSDKPNVHFAYLFGSRVKGYARATSDWDLAVYLDPPENPDTWPVFELEAELSREIGETVQVTDLNQELTPQYCFEIVRDGEELLSKDEDKRIEITSRMLRKYLDWMHFQNRHKE